MMGHKNVFTFVTVGIKSSGFRALGLPKRFFEWPVRLPNCSCNTVNSSKLTPTSFSSSSRTCLIKAPSTSAKPHLFARIGGNDKMESISWSSSFSKVPSRFSNAPSSISNAPLSSWLESSSSGKAADDCSSTTAAATYSRRIDHVHASHERKETNESH